MRARLSIGEAHGGHAPQADLEPEGQDDDDLPVTIDALGKLELCERESDREREQEQLARPGDEQRHALRCATGTSVRPLSTHLRRRLLMKLLISGSAVNVTPKSTNAMTHLPVVFHRKG